MVREITILSGKGGTGKTTLTASFTSIAKEKIVVADCDVDAPNLHILLKPRVRAEEEFKGSKVAVIDKGKCIECMACEENCRFNAISNLEIDPILCEGCGLCVSICPVEAVKLEESVSGYVFVSETKYCPMVHAKLNVAEENSGKLVTLVREKARKLAEQKGRGLVLVDGPPGIGCPVIASLTGIDLAIIITEPTESGIHDLERILKLAEHFGIKRKVIINLYNVNMDNTRKIRELCEKNNVEVLGETPYEPLINEATVKMIPVVEYSPLSDVSKKIGAMWGKVEAELGF